MPGETALPGEATGKSGVPTTRNAGSQFNATVNLTDWRYNRITGNLPKPVVAIYTTDKYDTEPPQIQLDADYTKTFPVTLVTAATDHYLCASTTNYYYESYHFNASTSPIFTVSAGAATRLQVVCPGETAVAGHPDGKTGSPTWQGAASAFTVAVNITDNNWNKITSASSRVEIVTSDPNDDQPFGDTTKDTDGIATVDGSANINVTMVTMGTWTVTAQTVSGYTTYTSTTSKGINIRPGGATRFQVLVPNETNDPGTSSGKTGTVQTRTAGLSFVATVLTTDNLWNIADCTWYVLVDMVTDDPYDV
ncbi:MAG: hypothetical protein AAB914_03545, partial [Patescibacteria group bacterium]